ncbi:hypothetical protein GOP47_0030416 [Adiantum capillus-veneris]|nr:hypothetical protein GOP47_0030022 [Adiantum capillus-veneris]KAI5055271.1 hypothetical protein GOP47_0030416 [Adiantum capillus-veneris]
MRSSLKRICRKDRFAKLDKAPWKLKQKICRHFASYALHLQESTIFMIPQKPNNTELQEALNQLDTIDHIDVHTYASLLNACASSNALSQGRDVHRHIMAHGNGVHTSLGFLILEMYGKCGAVQDAAAWFEEVPCYDASPWNYMMGLYMRHGWRIEALHLFNQMLQQALVNFYGKCGDQNHALQLFDLMPQCGTIAWNTLMSGYKQNKQCKESIRQLVGSSRFVRRFVNYEHGRRKSHGGSLHPPWSLKQCN